MDNKKNGDDSQHVVAEFNSHEFTSSYFSPEATTPSTPPPQRVLSSRSLAGEDILVSSTTTPTLTRRNSSQSDVDVELSPFTPPDALLASPDLQIPDQSLSPPPIMNNQYNNNIIEYQPQSGHSAVAATSPFLASSGNNNNTNSSRPPRVPQVSLQPSNSSRNDGRQNQQQQHGRVLSNTDYSFLSQLTESPSEFSVPKRRTLSWDNNDRRESPTDVSHVSTPASILQPVLDDGNGPDNVSNNNNQGGGALPESIFTNNRTMNTSINSGSSFARTTSLSLSDQGSTGSYFDRQTNNQASTSSQAPIQMLESSTNYGGFRTPPQQSEKSIIEDAIRADSSDNNRTTFQAFITTAASSDTGSFVRTSTAPYTEPLKTAPPPRTAPIQKKTVTVTTVQHGSDDTPTQTHYSLQDVLEAAPKEGEEESTLLKNLEAQQQKSGSFPIHSLRMMDANLLNATTGDGEEEQIVFQSKSTDQGAKAPSKFISPFAHLENSPDNLNALTKKLAAVSPSKDPELEAKRAHHRRVTAFGTLDDNNPLNYLGSSSKTDDVEAGGSRIHRPSSTPKSGDSAKRSHRRGRPKPRHFLSRVWRELKNDCYFFVDFVAPKKEMLYMDFSRVFKVVVLPSTITATLLFYGFGNPPRGDKTNDEGNPVASASWWLLFLGVRQVITLGIAVLVELVVIQFWTFRTKTFPKFLGPTLTLLFAHSRGWPSQLVSWVFIDLVMLFGETSFSSHWLFWQDAIDLMNANNPSGDIVNSSLYFRVLMSALLLGSTETIKRAWLGTSGGKHLVVRYGKDLTRVVYKLVIISEIANLPRLLEDRSIRIGVETAIEQRGSFDYTITSNGGASELALGSENVTSLKANVAFLLEEWDEPELQEPDEQPTMASILQFRKTLSVISDEFPFSVEFGSALNRAKCVQSSQRLYEILTRNGSSDLEFDFLSRIADMPDGTLDRAKARELKYIFRPNSSGHISKIDFVKSIDSVYKSLRMLLASVRNSSQIDQAYDRLVSTTFFIIMFFVILGILGVDINALFLFISGLIVSFAFMIGSACSKYLEGLLFILVRKPFDIGDRIEIDAVTGTATFEAPTSSVIVEKVDLFTTTVRFTTTREVATYSNGSLANTRIINLKRSERANVYMNLKFGVDATSEQVEEFKNRVIQFTEDRPREWASVVACRCIRIEADLGFMEYHVALQHRDSWQSLPGILRSKGVFLSFALETQKELGLKYSAPRLPIDVLPAKNRSQEELPFPFDRAYSEEPSREPKKDR